jgi:hypothetical protein
MAIDNTPPRLRLIITIAVIVVITLVSLEFVFKSYYAYMTDEAKLEKTAPKTALLAQIKAEKEAFGGAKMPVDQAMSQIAKGTRPELIDPKPSDDVAALTGWNKLPKQPPVPAPAPNDVRGAAPAATDAGVLATGDAGAITDGGAAMMDARATTNDAGAPAPAPTPHTNPKTPGHP